jgi:adenosine deaminase
MLDLGREYNLPLPAWDLEGLRPYVQVTDPQPGIMAFIAKFRWPLAILVNYEACRRIAYENVEDARNDGIDYIELRFSPWFMAEPNDLKPAGVVEAVVEGIQAGQRDFGVRTNLIGILSRTYGPAIAAKELKALTVERERIVGLDLAGDEANFPGKWYREQFRRGRELGWHITVHAGEAAGPESVWQAIQELGAERIGHALRAVEDPALMEYMAEHCIGVESCLTSNVQTSCVPDFASHPLRRFLERGIPATINTDDPGISGTDLHNEFDNAAARAGLTARQIKQAQINAMDVAFLSEGERKGLRLMKVQAPV